MPGSIVVPLIFLVIPLTLLQRCGAADSITYDLKSFNCSGSGNFSSGGAYAMNLRKFLVTLPSKVINNGGSFNGSVGSTNGVFGMAMCQADLPWPDHCESCLQAATAEAPKACPSSFNTSVAYRGCVLRYWDTPVRADVADALFYYVSFYTPEDAIRVEDATALSQVRRDLFLNLSNEIVTSPLMIASGNRTFNSTHNLYGLAQCYRDWPKSLCARYVWTVGGYWDYENQTWEGLSFTSYALYLRYSLTPFQVYVPDNSSGGPAETPKGTGSPSRRSFSTGAVVGTVVGVVVTVTSIACLVYRFLCKPGPLDHVPLADETRKEATSGEGMPSGGRSTVHQQARPVHTERMILLYEQLLDATDKFSDSRLLGKGQFGAVYEAKLDNYPRAVAMKRILNVNEQNKSLFANEVNNISRLESHDHLVPFVGSCNDHGELLLVYEMITNGSLHDHLHNRQQTLAWDKRYKVATGIASALVYMHKKDVIHRDIKPANVMLDEEFNAKVGDFGLVRQVDRDRTSQTMTIIGDYSYIDPESIETYRAGKASDIYSFGVVLLEIASGEEPKCKTPKDPNTNVLIEKFRGLYNRDDLLKAADTRLDGRFDEVQMKHVMLVGLQCVQHNHNWRPSSEKVLDYLKDQKVVPQPQRQSIEAVHRTFQFNELSAATNNFSNDNKLGEGGFGKVFKGQVGTTFVAVKKIKDHRRAVEDFHREIQVICRLSHRNLLPLVGWCSEGGKLLLVYELMHKGCLSEYLHKPGPPRLDWDQRFNIIVGVASALAYLHEDSSKQRVLHRDIKPSNIMLDDSYTAMLGDFGLVRRIDKNITSEPTDFRGTHSYTDPEYFKTSKARWQSDVYSFGIVALEIALVQKPGYTCEGDELKNTLVQYALQMHGNKEIFNEVCNRQIGPFNEEQMHRVIEAGVLCVDPDPSKRPYCSDVKNYLQRGHDSGLKPSSSASMSRQDSAEYKTCSSSSFGKQKYGNRC